MSHVVVEIQSPVAKIKRSLLDKLSLNNSEDVDSEKRNKGSRRRSSSRSQKFIAEPVVHHREIVEGDEGNVVVSRQYFPQF